MCHGTTPGDFLNIHYYLDFCTRILILYRPKHWPQWVCQSFQSPADIMCLSKLHHGLEILMLHPIQSSPHCPRWTVLRLTRMKPWRIVDLSFWMGRSALPHATAFSIKSTRNVLFQPLLWQTVIAQGHRGSWIKVRYWFLKKTAATFYNLACK